MLTNILLTYNRLFKWENRKNGLVKLSQAVKSILYKVLVWASPNWEHILRQWFPTCFWPRFWFLTWSPKWRPNTCIIQQIGTHAGGHRGGGLEPDTLLLPLPPLSLFHCTLPGPRLSEVVLLQNLGWGLSASGSASPTRQCSPVEQDLERPSWDPHLIPSMVNKAWAVRPQGRTMGRGGWVSQQVPRKGIKFPEPLIITPSIPCSKGSVSSRCVVDGVDMLE